jgi:hypothetical protein
MNDEKTIVEIFTLALVFVMFDYPTRPGNR